MIEMMNMIFSTQITQMKQIYADFKLIQPRITLIFTNKFSCSFV